MRTHQSHLDRLVEVIQCVACDAPCHVSRAHAGLTCDRCGRQYPLIDGVLIIDAPDEQPEIAAERQGVALTERNPALGGINAAFENLATSEGALKDAILALPAGDGSRFYREPGYFRNVAQSLRGFRYVTDHLPRQRGQRLLDIGADLTWSTNHFAREGLVCTALDVNHHLTVGELFQRHYQAAYDMVRADMHAAVFHPESFDLVVVFNALHHSGDIHRVASNIARVLKPGGRLAAVEPYCVDPAQKEDFGRAQIEAGINEHTYLLDEWHAAFMRAGLRLESLMLSDSCNMIYGKPPHGERPEVDASLLARAHAGRLVARPPRDLPRAGRAHVDVDITNASNATWCSEGRAPIFASYHLSREIDGSDRLIAFDNRRTAIPDIEPGRTVSCRVEIDLPSDPGLHRLTFDLVQEGICWFAERGFGTDTVCIDTA